MTEGVRFLHKLIEQFRMARMMPPRDQEGMVIEGRVLAEGARGYRAQYSYLGRLLDDPETKRLLFDSRQATLFDDIGERVSPNVQPKLHAPFNQFYMEFTEPIAVGEPQPSFEEDRARGFLFLGDSGYNVSNPEGDDSPISGVLASMVWFFSNEGDVHDKPQFIDRGFYYHMTTGTAWTRIESITQGKDPSEVPDHWIETAEASKPDSVMVVAGQQPGGEERYIGWWERAIQDYADIFSWILAYTMAKSIEIRQEPVSRQVRRWHERKNQPLKPWHIVRVKPKFVTAQPTEGLGTQHSYRYDVIGHLRLGRHKMGDGTYREQYEWVPPHQRGLQHSLYIPKTYKVERGKTVSRRMEGYWGKEQDKKWPEH